jgi:hypothetical protein
VNVIGFGKFIPAGTESPFRSIDEVPENLRGFVLQSGDQPDDESSDEPRSLNYMLNTSYDLDSRGFRRSRVGREVIRLEQAAAE